MLTDTPDKNEIEILKSKEKRRGKPVLKTFKETRKTVQMRNKKEKKAKILQMKMSSGICAVKMTLVII